MTKYLLSAVAALTFILPSQKAQAVGPTYIKDAVSLSTTWTKDNSPYVIQNDIAVSKGAVLTIEPGVEIRFTVPTSGKVGAGPNLVIQGGLRAVGNSASPISFSPAVQGSLWGAIYFYNCDPANALLQGCLIKGGRIVCNGSSPTIAQCAIYGAKSGVEVAMNSQPQISGDKITANGIGIVLLSDSASPIVSGNEIYNNNYGFYFKDFGMPSISGNKIYSNLKYNFVNYSAKPIAAPNNDFRALDYQQIARTIYDGTYNASLGKVNVVPFVGMAAGQTAPVVAAQTTGKQGKPDIKEDEFWSYGRPFDAMKMSNVDQQKTKPSTAIKVLAIGATAVVSAVLLFL